MQKQTSQWLRAIFDVNHPLWQLAERGFSVVLLNLLFVLTCLPLVTYGMAKLSLIASLQALRENQKIPVLATYLKELRRQGRRGLQLGLMELAVTGFCLFDLYLIQGQTGFVFQMFQVLCYGLLGWSQIIWLYAYPAAAAGCSMRELFVRSLLQSGVYLSLTAGAVLVMALLLACLLLSGFSFLVTLSLLLLVGYAALTALFLGRLSARMSKQPITYK